MRKQFDNSEFKTAPLTQEDWNKFKAFCVRVYGEDTYRFLEGKDPEVQENWTEYLARSNQKTFGLFKGDDIVGMAEIIFKKEENQQVFTAILIEPEYRKRGLSTHLHDVRKRFLKENPCDGDVTTKIWTGNTPSIEAAKRNGFVEKGTIIEDGAKYHLLQLENP